VNNKPCILQDLTHLGYDTLSVSFKLSFFCICSWVFLQGFLWGCIKVFAFPSYKICGPWIWKRHATSGTSHSRDCLSVHSHLAFVHILCFVSLFSTSTTFESFWSSQIWGKIKVCQRSRRNSLIRKSSVYTISKLCVNASFKQ